MYRTRGVINTGPSKASATTICQKCLQKGHYSYECKTSLQSRPYNSRPSRTQQLRNPKLKPALTADKLNVPKEEVSMQAPDIIHISTEKHHSTPSTDNGPDTMKGAKSRSASVSSDASISTISTQKSDSFRVTNARKRLSPDRTEPRRYESESRSRSAERTRRPGLSDRSRSPRRPVTDDRRRRDRSSSATRKRRRSESLESEGGSRPNRRSSSPYRKQNVEFEQSDGGRNVPRAPRIPQPRPSKNDSDDRTKRHGRPRSLSPYSRRLALTQAMNAGR